MACSRITITLTAPGVDALRIAARALREIADEEHIGNAVLIAECALADVAEKLDGEPIVRRF